MVDFRKVFNLVDHKILRKKAKSIILLYIGLVLTRQAEVKLQQ